MSEDLTNYILRSYDAWAFAMLRGEIDWFDAFGEEE